MADITISPNMSLPIPVPGTAPGPDWANDIVADMYAIDSHDHTSGKGVPITPAALDINSDLSLGSNNAVDIRSVRFDSQSAALSDPADVGCLYEVSDDLYYNDGAGNQVRITQGGSVTGSTGTITGLPSGTASASFAGGAFTFQSATNTPATMNIGPIVTGAAVANAKTVTISASSSQPADYVLALPLALPASTSFFNVDVSGNMGTVASTGSGNVVLSNSPTITGVIKADDGSAAAPSYTFDSDQDTGFYRVGSGEIGVSSNGTIYTSLLANGVLTVGGSASQPSLGFRGDQDTGVYNGSANEWNVATGGAKALGVDDTFGLTVVKGVAAGDTLGGDGYIKWKVFSGTLASSNPSVTKATLTISGTQILGAVGYSNINGGSTWVIMDKDNTTGVSACAAFISNEGSTTTVRIQNNDTNSTVDYRVVVYYQ